MSIVRMKKATIYGLRRDQEALMRALMDAGCLETAEIRPEERAQQGLLPPDMAEDLASREAELQTLRFALNFIGEFERKKPALLAGRRALRRAELDGLLQRREELLLAADWARRLDTARSELKNRRLRLAARIEQLEPWRDLEVPVEQLHDTVAACVEAGVLPTAAVETLTARLEAEVPGCVIRTVHADREETCLFLVCHWRNGETFRALLKEYGYTRAAFEGSGTPAYILQGLQARLDAMTDTGARLLEDAKGLVAYRADLEALLDGLSLEQARARAAAGMALTRETFVLRGWVPEDAAAPMRQRLLAVTPACEIQLEDPGEEDDPPTMLENPSLVRPFESVTDLYSVPSYRGIDPNRLMAPFYFIFFGMMVSDAGYGIVLALGLFAALKLLKPRGMMRNLITLLCLGGVSTFLWGVLYGGWFGISLPPVWFNPQQQPITMLILCFALGAVQILVGLGIKAYMNISRGRVWDAVWDQFPWMLILLSVPLFLVPGLSTLGLALVGVSVLAILLMAGREKKNFFKRLTSGLGSLYDVTSYFSDILSYSRLFALGLATGVIAGVINSLASMLAGSVLGAIFMVAILIFGHVFNILINVLGAYVHASRLQYIEFFGKFYEGGGRTFAPLSRSTRYIDIID